MGKHVFVTVGTTKFDSLVQAVDNAVVLSSLCSKGFTSLTVQIGHGQHVPSFPVDQTALDCRWYRFKQTLHEDMARADVVVSHAGAGSVMEALGLGKALVVVVNRALMDNHQEELADALAQRNYLRATTPEGLAGALVELDDSPSARRPYPPAKPEAFAAIVDEEMRAAQDGR
ncbi:beta(1,4)-N-acetylglucosaminyltransferase [Ectocarpus siliculosus]|uniref:UDP-N-acetylglucosamine transferase subunit ALG13 n=1 Tax=Ectocarpus siliculosus TaxID=2880 RepID=D7FSK5_ECTSI|nr:beta(1,4)-N-acetylglucosaminyltransferase [Ectocarpus siliculosus]|eukprot:CBJ31146.1 beta(1,4)-N-acetylglucosaminyltransferase [Ectocarpus siliculosus]